MMEIKTGKLTTGEYNLLNDRQIKKYFFPLRKLNFDTEFNNLERLNIFNNTIGMQLRKFYDEDVFVGYAVIFLGFNGLDTNDISIEDLVYFGDINNERELDFIELLINDLKNSKDLPFEVADIYYDEDEFFHPVKFLLKDLGAVSKGRSR